jgi:hypothetical protein
VNTNTLTYAERKALMLERKTASKMLTIERKNTRRNIARMGGRY